MQKCSIGLGRLLSALWLGWGSGWHENSPCGVGAARHGKGGLFLVWAERLARLHFRGLHGGAGAGGGILCPRSRPAAGWQHNGFLRIELESVDQRNQWINKLGALLAQGVQPKAKELPWTT